MYYLIKFNTIWHLYQLVSLISICFFYQFCSSRQRVTTVYNPQHPLLTGDPAARY